MKCLVDTHVLLWLFCDDSRLSARTKEIYLTTKNQLYFSAASLWEISIKLSLGKISPGKNWFHLLTKHLHENSIRWLPISDKHCYHVSLLPFHHHDPFDRMLIAQALVDELKILTSNANFSAYQVECVW